MNIKSLAILGVIILTLIGLFVIKSSAPTSKSETGQLVSKAATPGQYLEYSPAVFAASGGSKRVYFFHASWCPTCKAANQEFMDNQNKIPADVIILKTDYDHETELKKLYGITYQHTFVYVDANGKELAKWNGGGITELVANTK